MAGNDAQTQFALLGVNLQQFAAVTKIKYEDVIRRVALQIFREVIQRTPVDTGRARAGWQVTINEPGTFVPSSTLSGHQKTRATDEQRKIVGGQQRAASNVFAQGPVDIGSFQAGDVVFIVNNVNYVIYLEQGTSQQAPAGMVAVTLAKVKTELEAIIALNS